MSSGIWKYKYFVDVIENRSFTKAGNINYVSQTAISQNITSLEKLAGGKLIHRGRGEIVPTQMGQIVYRRAKELLEIENTMIKEIEQLKEQDVTHIGIDSAINKKLWMIYEQVYDPYFRFGEAGMECYKLDSVIGTRMMKNRELDVFIGYDDPELMKEPEITYESLTISKLGIYVGKNTTIPHGNLRLEDLSGHKCYKAQMYSCSWQKDAEKRLEKDCPFIEVKNVETMKVKVEFNNGFAFVDSRYFYKNDGEIRRLEDYDKNCEVKMYYHTNGNKKDVQQFMKKMKKAMGA